MTKNRDDLTEQDKEYIHTMLDKLNVPRVSTTGIEFRLFGRIVILIETITKNNLLGK